MFTDWCWGRAFSRRIVGCFEDFLLSRRSIYDTHLNLSYALGWFEQRWCTQAWCKTWRINSLWKGKSKANIVYWWDFLKIFQSVNRSLWIIYAIWKAKFYKGKGSDSNNIKIMQWSRFHFETLIDDRKFQTWKFILVGAVELMIILFLLTTISIEFQSSKSSIFWN